MVANPKYMNKPAVNFTIDGDAVSAFENETILQAAKR
ncbi:MAG: 2Fe-2S iron-sulfur cluster-binding protein, partial [Gammaproteobacteria bacterium]